MLAETAHNAGVITNEEFAIFQNAGYMGLYGGLDVDDIQTKMLASTLEVEESLFLEFLARNNALYRDDNKIISDGALVAITLMIAESRPEEKDIMVNLVMNFLTM